MRFTCYRLCLPCCVPSGCSFLLGVAVGSFVVSWQVQLAEDLKYVAIYGPGGVLTGQECRDCGTTQMPLWRQYLEVTYCNACCLRRKRADDAYIRTNKPSRCILR